MTQVPSFDHTTVDIPHPIRTAQSSIVGPNQYCGGGPRGNLGCRMFFWAWKKKILAKKNLGGPKKSWKKKFGEIFCEEPKFFVRSQLLRPLPVPILGREKWLCIFLKLFVRSRPGISQKFQARACSTFTFWSTPPNCAPESPPPRTHLPVVKKKRKKTNRQTNAKSHANVTTR